MRHFTDNLSQPIPQIKCQHPKCRALVPNWLLCCEGHFRVLRWRVRNAFTNGTPYERQNAICSMRMFWRRYPKRKWYPPGFWGEKTKEQKFFYPKELHAQFTKKQRQRFRPQVLSKKKDGRCGFKLPGGWLCAERICAGSRFCAHHRKTICAGCGNPAIKLCDFSSAFICAVPLCLNCEHKTFKNHEPKSSQN